MQCLLNCTNFQNLSDLITEPAFTLVGRGLFSTRAVQNVLPVPSALLLNCQQFLLLFLTFTEIQSQQFYDKKIDKLSSMLNFHSFV